MVEGGRKGCRKGVCCFFRDSFFISIIFLLFELLIVGRNKLRFLLVKYKGKIMFELYKLKNFGSFFKIKIIEII